MGQPLSHDLRTRVVAAVSGGLSRRAAAERFGVSAATAIRWVQAVTTTGSCRSKPQGGDTRSRGTVILTRVPACRRIRPCRSVRKRRPAWR